MLVHDPAFGSKYIFLPLALHMDQRPLPPAKDEVLDA